MLKSALNEVYFLNLSNTTLSCCIMFCRRLSTGPSSGCVDVEWVVDDKVRGAVDAVNENMGSGSCVIAVVEVDDVVVVLLVAIVVVVSFVLFPVVVVEVVKV